MTLGPYGQLLEHQMNMRTSHRMMESLFRFRGGKFMKMLEAEGDDEKKGWKWDCVVIKFGESTNGPDEEGFTHFYPKEAAEKSLAVFEGASVYANKEGDFAGHKTNPNEKVTPDIVGVLTNVKVTESEMVGQITFLPSGKWLRDNLMAIEADPELAKNNPYQLSIDAGGWGEKTIDGDKRLFVATEFERVALDVVNKGAAGGKFLRMAASRVAAPLSFNQLAIELRPVSA